MKFPEIVFALHYSNHEMNFGELSGGSDYGNKLLEPIVRLKSLLESKGYKVLTRAKSDIRSADIVVFLDMNAELWALAQSLSKSQYCILICLESPIYTPLSHAMNVVFSKRWNKVMTWNRSLRAEHVQYFDIPVAEANSQEVAKALRKTIQKYNGGVVVSSRKEGDYRGLLDSRDSLYKALAYKGEVDLYGMNWPCNPKEGLYGSTSDKIATLQEYNYSLVVENSLYPGYVTEKLADSITAGIPAIYYGDTQLAGQRFPGTFIVMEDISENSFFRAKEKLIDNYEELRRNVQNSIVHSSLWCESFLNAFVETIEAVQEERRMP